MAHRDRDFERVNRITEKVIGAAIAVHRERGPGLLESSYQRCMGLELEDGRLKVEHQVWLPLVYRGVRIERVYRLDMVVQNAVILEIKAVKALEPIFDAQMLTYLRLSGCRVGLIINFNQRIVTEGIRRLVL